MNSLQVQTCTGNVALMTAMVSAMHYFWQKGLGSSKQCGPCRMNCANFDMIILKQCNRGKRGKQSAPFASSTILAAYFTQTIPTSLDLGSSNNIKLYMQMSMNICIIANAMNICMYYLAVWFQYLQTLSWACLHNVNYANVNETA